MKIDVLPPSGRVVGVVTLKKCLALDCELKPIDLGRGDTCRFEPLEDPFGPKVLTMSE